MAECPAHVDDKPSLHFTVSSENNFVIHCFAGCEWSKILEAASGLTVVSSESNGHSTELVSGSARSPLDEWAEYTQVSRDFWESMGIVQEGLEIAFRWPGKRFRKVRNVRDKTFRWVGKPSGATLWPYPVVPIDGEIILCEGESDCGILRYNGFPAYTFGGVEAVRGDDAAEILRAWGVEKITIIFDCDRAGRTSSIELRDSLLDAGIPTSILDISRLVDRTNFENDIRDVWLRNPEAFKSSILELFRGVETAYVSSGSSDYADRAPDNIPWLCEPYLTLGSLTLLCSEAKGGKTTFTFALLREMRPSLTGGLARSFLGKHVRPGNVLYLTEDNPITWKVKRDAFLPNNEDSHIRVVPALESIESTWLERVAMIERELRVLDNISLVVVDTIPIWADLENENDPTQVNRALDPLRRLAGRTNTAILAIHYYNKSGSIRGSTSFEAVPDVLLDLEVDPTRETRTLSVRGKLTATDPDPIDYKLEHSTKEDAAAKLVVVESDKLPKSILECFTPEDTQGLTLTEICERMGLRNVQSGTSMYQRMRRILRDLVYQKALVEDTSVKPARYKRFVVVTFRKHEHEGEDDRPTD